MTGSRPSTTIVFAITLACAVTAFGAAGCGGGDRALDAAGRLLPPARVYMSVPLTGPLGARGRDVADAARLALKQTKFNAGDRPLELIVRDSAPADGSAPPISAARVAATAREASADENAVALLGDLAPEAVPVELRQTMRSRNLIVSLAIAVSESQAAGRLAPRVVWLLPSSRLRSFALDQARAQGSGADDAGDSDRANGANQGDAAAATDRPTGARTGDRRPVELVPDDPSREVNSSVLLPIKLVSPALLPEQFPAGGARFYAQFEAEYGRRPDRFAIFAYDAVGLIDQAIQKAAADAEDRAANYGPPEVAAAAFRVRDRFSAVGHYDILPSGQSTLYQFTVREADEPPDQEPEDLPRVIEARR